MACSGPEVRNGTPADFLSETLQYKEAEFLKLVLGGRGRGGPRAAGMVGTQLEGEVDGGEDLAVPRPGPFPPNRSGGHSPMGR